MSIAHQETTKEAALGLRRSNTRSSQAMLKPRGAQSPRNASPVAHFVATSSIHAVIEPGVSGRQLGCLGRLTQRRFPLPPGHARSLRASADDVCRSSSPSACARRLAWSSGRSVKQLQNETLIESNPERSFYPQSPEPTEVN